MVSTLPMARVRLRGFAAIDRRTAGARVALAFKHELIASLGGEADLSPQRRKLVDMTARAALLLDHVDAWLVEQRSLVNQRNRTLLPIVTQPGAPRPPAPPVPAEPIIRCVGCWQQLFAGSAPAARWCSRCWGEIRLRAALARSGLTIVAAERVETRRLRA